MIKFSHTLSLFLVATMSNSTFANSKSYISVENFIESIPYVDSSRALVAEGDLNGDKLKDFVVVVTVNPEELESYNQLHVLVQEKSGRFFLAISSKQSPVVGMGCCWVGDIKIKRGSVFVENVDKSACDVQKATHQFKFYKDTWRLIGLNISNYKLCGESDVLVEADYNFLTGNKIISTQIGDQPKTYKRMEFISRKFLLKDYEFNHEFGLP